MVLWDINKYIERWRSFWKQLHTKITSDSDSTSVPTFLLAFGMGRTRNQSEQFRQLNVSSTQTCIYFLLDIGKNTNDFISCIQYATFGPNIEHMTSSVMMCMFQELLKILSDLATQPGCHGNTKQNLKLV